MKKSGKKMNKKVDILTTLLALLAIALLVGLAAAQEATRSHPIEVDPGAEFDVNIDVSDLGSFGKANETLPTGFTYVSSSLPSGQITIVGDVLSFILFPAADFTYRVKASETPGTYTFTGKVWDWDKNEYIIPSTEVIVLSPTPAPSPSPS